MKTIAFVNQKGGVAKTTTCLNVGAGLSLCGFKCLLVDIDPQGSLSVSAGYDAIQADETTVYEVLKGSDINAAIRHGEHYDLLVTDIRLAGADLELASVPGREMLLRQALDNLGSVYDYMLLDCPPSLNILTLMALTAADEVIIPVQTKYLALNGVKQLTDTIKLIQKRMNPKLKLTGVIGTFYDARRGLDQAVLESLKQAFGDAVYETTISENTAIAQAPSRGQDIFTYNLKSKGAIQYKALVDEFIKRHEATERK